MAGNRYADAGVDLAAGNRTVDLIKAAVHSTHGPQVLSGVGAFGGLFDAAQLKEMGQPVLVSSTDGVGTKTAIASALGRFDSIGHDIVNHCIDDILVQGAQPLFFLDYIAAAKLLPERIAEVVGGVAQACRHAGCALLGGETAEMPGVYELGGFDLVGTIVGALDRERLIDGSTVTAGDAIIGLSSSGLHTNGFTLARSIFADWDLTAPVVQLGTTLGDALLQPHRSYLKPVRKLWQHKIAIKGMAHITGGGLLDNPPRSFPSDLTAQINRGSWTVPPIFGLMQQHGEVSDEEMLHVFNMGLGMLLYVPAQQAAQALAILEEGAWQVGVLEPRGDGKPVQLV